MLRKGCLVFLFGWMFLCAERNPHRVEHPAPEPVAVTILMEAPVH